MVSKEQRTLLYTLLLFTARKNLLEIIANIERQIYFELLMAKRKYKEIDLLKDPKRRRT